jgi:hypothetical protein
MHLLPIGWLPESARLLSILHGLDYYATESRTNSFHGSCRTKAGLVDCAQTAFGKFHVQPRFVRSMFIGRASDARASSCFVAREAGTSTRQVQVVATNEGAPVFVWPNVRAKRATTACRQAWAVENVRAPTAQAWWHAVGAPLERRVRAQRAAMRLPKLEPCI